jgi:pimeloyl-ACP methyl ester carboxylesterase
VIEALERAAQRLETPCGAGVAVWRVWGEGEPLVLFHGGSGSWLHWVRTIPRFLALGRRVVCPDTPGLGDSALPPDGSSPAGVAAPLAEALPEVLGGAAADLVGFSFGANIAGHAALARPELARSLTLVGAASLGLPRAPVELVKVRTLAGEERRAAHRTNLERLMIHDPARVDELALEIQEWNTRHARFVSRGFALGASLREAVERVACPLGGIWGEFDQVARPGGARERLDLLRAIRPDLREAVIPGAGHWVAYEAGEAFNAALAGMLPAAEPAPRRPAATAAR